jgi:cell division protein FtsW
MPPAPSHRARAATRARHPSAAARRRAATHPKRTAAAKRTGAVTVQFAGLLGVVGILATVGLIEVLSASSVEALRAYGSAWVFFERQVAWLVAGAAPLLLALRVDYRRWRKLSAPILVVSVGLLVLVLVPGVGVTVSGSTRWLGAGSLRMQPSELAKLGVLFAVCEVLARRAGGRMPTLQPVLAMFAVVGGLIMLEPDMGTMLVVMCVVMALLFVSGTPVRQLAGLLGIGACGAFLLGIVEPYRRARLTSFVHPFKDAGNTGYQVVQSLVGLGSGGIVGVGIGASRAKWGFLPNAHTDFIFAIIGEEWGLLGGLFVVALFGAFAVLGVQTARRAPDRFGALVATGITAWVVGQAFINIGAVIGILPVTGVPLPFVSFGGSSLVILLFAVGVLLNVARHGRPPRRRAPASTA